MQISSLPLGLWLAVCFGTAEVGLARAQSGCGEPPLVAQVGLPSLGSAGYPTLLLEGAPLTGYPAQLRVCGAVPSAPGILLVGAALAPLALPGFAATVQPGDPLLFAGFQVAEDGCSPPLVPLSPVPAFLCGLEVVCQAAVLDAGAVGGAAFTRGARVRFGAPPDGPAFPTQLLEIGDSPHAVAVADFDADGHLDALVTSDGPSEVVLARGLGNGAFEVQDRFPVQQTPIAIAAGDLNADSLPDAITANLYGGSISVLIGLAGGGFAPALNLPAGGHGFTLGPRSVTIGDLNADGRPDLAVANSFKLEVLVFFGDGTGAFSAPLVLKAGSQPYYAAIADLDLDGVQDLAVANRDSNTLTLFFGTGGGGFAAGQTIFSGPFPCWIDVADVNEDGLPDLVASKRYLDSGIALLLGLGAGQFAYPIHIESAGGPFSVQAVDLDLDQDLDLLVGNEEDEILVHPGNGDGTFSAPFSFPLLTSMWIAPADVNEDGWLDLVTSGKFLSALLSLGNGGFFQPLELSLSPGWGAWDVALADLDGDVADDIVAVLLGSKQVAVTLRTPAGDIGPTALYAAGEDPVAVTAGDWNGDGRNDLAVANRNVDLSILLNEGLGTFGDAQPFAVGGPGSQEVNAIANGDLDGDGDLDLALANKDTGSVVTILYGHGDGTFQAPTLVPAASFGYPDTYTVAIADLDGDGASDLSAGMAGFPYGEVTVVLGGGDGTFSTPTGHPVHDAWTLEVADLDADGDLDLVSANSVFLGAGDGTFTQSVEDLTGPWMQIYAVGDVDRDLIPDLIRANGISSGPSYLLRGIGDGTFEDPVPLAAVKFPMLLGDLTGDLLPDVLLGGPIDRLTLLPNGLLLGP